MNNEIDNRLTKEAPFQKTTDMLAMLVTIFEETTEDALKNMNLSEVEADKFRAKSRKGILKILLDNPPPGIDQDSLKAFCE